MALDVVDLLLNRIQAHGAPWPPRSEKAEWGRARFWRAFLDNDRDRLKKIADWQGDRKYKVDPLAGRIADARGDYLWGEDPRIAPANDRDEDLLVELLDGQDDFVGGLHDAERTIGGEGDVFWRIYVDTDIADVPLLEWHPRDRVIPVYVGRRLMGLALVSTLSRPNDRGPYHRHFEVHEDGAVVHLLFRGTKSKLGTQVDLDDHDDTADLTEALTDGGNMRAVWDHGLPMLMGRLVNRRRRGNTAVVAVSDLDPIQDFLLDLNEAQTVGAENMRLTAKRRVVVPSSAVTPQTGMGSLELVDRGDGIMVPANGRSLFDAGEDVLIADPIDAELGKGNSHPFQVLEYSFDAEPLIAWKRDLVETTLTRVGITPQWVGVVTDQRDGLAMSGTALRFKLLPTSVAGQRWARPWDGNLGPVILPRMAQVAALSEEEGGFGIDWADPETAFAVERANPLPTDDVEDAQVETARITSRTLSRKTAIRNQHPDWTEEQVDDELDLIAEDQPSPTSAMGALGLA